MSRRNARSSARRCGGSSSTSPRRSCPRRRSTSHRRPRTSLTRSRTPRRSRPERSLNRRPLRPQIIIILLRLHEPRAHVRKLVLLLRPLGRDAGVRVGARLQRGERLVELGDALRDVVGGGVGVAVHLGLGAELDLDLGETGGRVGWLGRRRLSLGCWLLLLLLRLGYWRMNRGRRLLGPYSAWLLHALNLLNRTRLGLRNGALCIWVRCLRVASEHGANLCELCRVDPTRGDQVREQTLHPLWVVHRALDRALDRGQRIRIQARCCRRASWPPAAAAIGRWDGCRSRSDSTHRRTWHPRHTARVRRLPLLLLLLLRLLYLPHRCLLRLPHLQRIVRLAAWGKSTWLSTTTTAAVASTS